MPDGIRWNLNVSPLRTIVWPALLPPWKRTTASARSASRSTIFPLPSSPHWAPTMAIPGIAGESRAPSARKCFGALEALRRRRVEHRLARVGAPQRQQLAHLLQPRDDPRCHLLGQLAGV